MPLIHRRTVALLPPPRQLKSLPAETPVFYLKATGEIFLDYDDYSARLRYLSAPHFQCEYSGKTGFSYFAALESEKAESQIVRERFPEELKGRVLHSVQFQVMGRLDGLVDLVFERYKDRYFAGEKVFVDLGGDKYFARISRVFPPSSIRARADEEREKEQQAAGPNKNGHTFSSPLSSITSSPPAQLAADDYSSVCHKTGINLNIPPDDARAQDPPEEYFYTVQLMDEDHKFEGSYMEVQSKAMSRDRLAFSKSIVKRYLRECLHRDAAIGAPWVVKPPIALQFGISQTRTEAVDEKNREEREKVLAKRRKGTEEATAMSSKAPASKRRKTADKSRQDDDAVSTTSTDRKPSTSGAGRPVKYPIEDLDLDPMSIHDGRALRRVNPSADSPPLTLPPKPVPSRELLVPTHLFRQFVTTWNFLNVFGKPLNLSPITLDEFAGALQHEATSRKERCRMIAELHASLTNVIGSDTSRVLGSTGASVLPFVLAEKAGEGDDEDGAMAAGEDDDQEDELADDGDDGASSIATNGRPARSKEDLELDMLIRTGMRHARRWDRTAKLKSAEGRDGWEKHMIGALCQRGGPRAMPNLARILRHLFQGADLSLPIPGVEPHPDRSDPRSAYPTLPLEDKLEILAYLCTLVSGSKAVRAYMDESETLLTGLRKHRADVNKERRELLDQREALEAKLQQEALDAAAAREASALPPSTNDMTTMSGAANPVNGSEAAAKTNGVPSVLEPVTASNGARAGAVDDEEDQLDDDDETDQLMSDPVGPTRSPSPSVSISSSAVKKGRRAPLAGRKSDSAAQAKEKAREREVARILDAERRDQDRARLDLDDQLRANGKRDDQVERDFRRWQDVSRCRPLGKDRFFCRYWWFDGIGGASLVREAGSGSSGGGGGVQYGAGRLFVQGPSAEDWAFAAERARRGNKENGHGAKDASDNLEARRKREEVDEKAVLGVDEWGFYENEDEIEALQTWLNAKGTRELGLKNAIAKWRGYILAGARKRQAETATGGAAGGSSHSRSTDTRGRRKDEPDVTGAQYLYWQNKLAKY